MIVGFLLDIWVGFDWATVGKILIKKHLDIFDGTNNPGGTRKPDNPLKGIRNPIPLKLDNPLKRIRDLVPKEIQSQWPRGLTVPT